jgi:hypothetical protein
MSQSARYTSIKNETIFLTTAQRGRKDKRSNFRLVKHCFADVPKASCDLKKDHLSDPREAGSKG